jgi:hypothetical protein
MLDSWWRKAKLINCSSRLEERENLRKSLCITAAAVCSFVASAAQTAKATILPVNGSVAPNSQPNPLSGTTLIAATGPEAFNVSLNGSSMAGNVQEWVVTNNPGNIFGGAPFLTFVFQLELDSGTSATGAPASIQHLGDSGFLGSFTDAGYTASTGSAFPNAADRSITGDEVEFDFLPPSGNPLPPPVTTLTVGMNTDYLIINTNQTRFAPSVLTIDGTLTANASGFAPAAVPEPTILAFGGIAGLGLLARRRRQS